MNRKKARPPTEELMLLDLVQRLRTMHQGRQAVHIHLSDLSTTYQKDDYIRIATKLFANNVNGLEGHLFVLEDDDLIFVCKDVPHHILGQAVERIRTLFLNDSLTTPLNADGITAFCSWYDLEKDYDGLLLLAQDKLNLARQLREEEKNKPSLYKRPIKDLEPHALSKLEKALQNVDVSSLARQQTVCTIIDKNAPQPLFEEIFISLADLQTQIAPDIEIASNMWLFRYLTNVLDKRVMRMLIHDGFSMTHPFSINMNVSNILSSDFTHFQNMISPRLKGRLVIELSILDVFADMTAFLFARDFLRESGFRICLDGLDHNTLPYYDRNRLDVDLIKLFWSPNAINTMPRSQAQIVRNLIMETGQAHVIMCRCDDQHAINTGHELGIVMFQGYEIDRLLAAKGRKWVTS